MTDPHPEAMRVMVAGISCGRTFLGFTDEDTGEDYATPAVVIHYSTRATAGAEEREELLVLDDYFVNMLLVRLARAVDKPVELPPGVKHWDVNDVEDMLPPTGMLQPRADQLHSSVSDDD